METEAASAFEIEKEERLPHRHNLNEMRRSECCGFECFLEKLGLTGQLTKTEIEAGSNCMFLCLAEQFLDQKLASNTPADRKVTAMAIRTVAVDYMERNRAEFECWLVRDVRDRDNFFNYCKSMRTEGRQGDELMLKATALGLQLDIQVFKFNTITGSICMYHFPREKPSEDSAEQIPREPDAEMVEARQGTLNIACYDYQHDGTTCHYNSVGKRPAGYEGTLLFRDPGSMQTTKRRKSEKQVRHVEGAAARATGALANEPSSHSAGAAELTRDRVSFSLLSTKGLHAFEKQFPSFCCPLCTSPLT